MKVGVVALAFEKRGIIYLNRCKIRTRELMLGVDVRRRSYSESQKLRETSQVSVSGTQSVGAVMANKEEWLWHR